MTESLSTGHDARDDISAESTVDTTVLRAQLDKKTQDVASMFDAVASRYDLMNTLLSGGMDHVWLQALVTALQVRPGDEVLDLAAGTGASSAAIAQAGAHVIACDLSEGMIAVGRERHPELTFVQGDATDLQFEDNTFDSVTISYGLRNVNDTHRALQEMLRVAKPGGTLVVNEFSTTRKDILQFHSIHSVRQNTFRHVRPRQ